MGEADPERLLAEALRAQAARTPVGHGDGTAGTPGEPVAGSGGTTGPVAGYGLLSGSDLPLALGTGAVDRRPERTARLREPEAPRAWWVLGLAVMLGVAAGAVVGLLTLI
ncbi:hypothetical protein [Actinokineospora bangkokensis]|uniref:Uncharacterized protein n=1 Tax=Actinokineospora bangkokensis TaxID=1193682 RepID=A0A1Q9LFV8_9PSEU|nr:hypothetical protein [Actinokineospora bangkokensis]OLR90927.1 hypothetical protein BJP25_30695 [Actinokineospora bangkokensis]